MFVRKYVVLARCIAGDALKLNIGGRHGTKDVGASSLHGA